jgi:membrane fusion protein (multidrug efflux system)
MDAKSAPRAEEPGWRPGQRDEPAERAGRTERPIAKDRPEQEKPDQRTDQAQADKPRLSVRETLRRHPYAAAGGVIALVLLLAAGVLWWLHARQCESTDDAS